MKLLKNKKGVVQWGVVIALAPFIMWGLIYLLGGAAVWSLFQDPLIKYTVLMIAVIYIMRKLK